MVWLWNVHFSWDHFTSGGMSTWKLSMIANHFVCFPFQRSIFVDMPSVTVVDIDIAGVCPGCVYYIWLISPGLSVLGSVDRLVGIMNSLVPEWRQFCKYIFQTHFTRIDVFSTSCEICLRWVPHDPIDDKSTLDQVMAWCRQATSHYMRKCWPRSLLPYCVTRHSESIMICWLDLKLTMSKNMPSQGAGDSAETTLKNHVKLPVVITGFYTSGKSRSYYDMARVVRPSVNDIWLSTEVTTCQINFNFTDIMHLLFSAPSSWYW